MLIKNKYKIESTTYHEICLRFSYKYRKVNVKTVIDINYSAYDKIGAYELQAGSYPWLEFDIYMFIMLYSEKIKSTACFRS